MVMYTSMETIKNMNRRIIVVLCIISASVAVGGCSSFPFPWGSDIDKYDFTKTLRPGVASIEAAKPLEVIPLTYHHIIDELNRRSDEDLNAEMPPESEYTSYVVGPGDEVSITIWNNSELISGRTRGENVTQITVAADGSIYYPNIGLLSVADLNTQEIREELTKRLAVKFKDPQLDVAVTNYQSKKAFVVGEVNSPGPQLIAQNPPTLMDAISNAGGLTKEADLEHATLTRNNAVYSINLNNLFTDGLMSKNHQLLNKDVLKIPNIRVNGIFVLGEVTYPARLAMNGSMSLSAALKSAGKLIPLTRKVAQYFVIRRTQDIPKIFHLQSDALDASILADSFSLVAQDIVYVKTADNGDGPEIYEQVMNLLSEYGTASLDTTDTLTPSISQEKGANSVVWEK